MMGADSPFTSFVDRVREKFGLRTRFKLKVRDEGDLITMGDSDDWIMAVEAARRELEASEAGGEMGKMEVSSFNLILGACVLTKLSIDLDSGGRVNK